MESKTYLQTKIRSKLIAYILLFLFGAHFAYLERWGLQILYWFTLGGLGIWVIVEIFMCSSRVDKHNMEISSKIDNLERMERLEMRIDSN